jgi:Uncharacterized conserved protein
VSSFTRYVSRPLIATLALLGGACQSSDSTGAEPNLPASPFTLNAEGLGQVGDRFTAELSVHGNFAYTTTWGSRTVGGVAAVGNAIKIWNVSGATPTLLDSVIVSNATTLGDIQVTPDGSYLVVATEAVPGSIVIFDLSNPARPVQIARFHNDDTDPGVHTAEVQVVNGKLYGFLSIDPRNGLARLVIVDLSNPASPVEVFTKIMGTPFVHDVYVRDGILMTALWNDGMTIWDIGGGGKGGTPANPIQLGNVKTVGGKAHNIVWFHDAVTGSRKYAFVGEEGPGSIGSSSVGDVHVIDVSNLSSPREVGFFSVTGAGVHNFSADEQRGILYLAYYNAGVRAISTRGDLGTCSSSQKSTDGRCDLGLMGHEIARGLTSTGGSVYVWGVQLSGNNLYASDMVNGLWRLPEVPAF